MSTSTDSEVSPTNEQGVINVFLSQVERLNIAPLTRSNFRRTNDSLYFSYEPNQPRGFSVQAQLQEGEFWLDCEGWHEHFAIEGGSEEKFAQSCLEKLITLLNGQTTLKVSKAGRWPYKWELIYKYADDKHESLGVTGLLVFNYFGRRQTYTLKNAESLPVVRFN